MAHRRTKALHPTKKVRQRVLERDSYDGTPCCVNCGTAQTEYVRMELAHIRSKAQSGVGDERNLVLLCPDLSKYKCHHVYDKGKVEQSNEIHRRIVEHMALHYGDDWSEADQKYQKEGI